MGSDTLKVSELKVTNKAAARQRWYDALLSGQYVQLRGRLGALNCYCVLGVACEVFYQELGVERVVEEDGSISYDGYRTNMPPDVQEHLGLTNRGCATAMGLNDLDYTFEQIVERLTCDANRKHYFVA